MKTEAYFREIGEKFAELEIEVRRKVEILYEDEPEAVNSILSIYPFQNGVQVKVMETTINLLTGKLNTPTLFLYYSDIAMSDDEFRSKLLEQ